MVTTSWIRLTPHGICTDCMAEFEPKGHQRWCLPCTSKHKKARWAARKPVVRHGPCACGCGQLIALKAHDGSKRSFVSGHNSRLRGITDKWGYKSIRGRKAHIVIAEAVLGKKLPAGAVVHHVNGNRLDNTHQNLVICENQSYHMLFHKRRRGPTGRWELM